MRQVSEYGRITDLIAVASAQQQNVFFAFPTADSCPTIETAGVVWQRTASSEVFITPCHEVDNSLHGANVVRECSLDGVWEEPDYTRCTIESKSPPFILLWVVAEESNGEELEEILAQINTLV